MILFGCGLSDIFPKDTLSCNTSKFFELSPKDKNSSKNNCIDKGDGELSPGGAAATASQSLDLAGLFNRLRDQDNIISSLKDEIIRTRA